MAKKEERILDAKRNETEDASEITLRPKTIDEYVGQKEIIDNLKIFIGAAKHRDETLDHVLLYGPPGLGKTTLAYVIANEMGANIKTINGPSIEKTGDLASLLSTLEPGDILFIDEIHRLPRVVEEVLYGAMEDFRLSILINRGGNATSLNLDLPPFTLIGATTRVGDLSSPLRARFGITNKMSYYTNEEIEKIVKRSAKALHVKIDEDAVKLIASRSRGTPRIANRLLKRVRDFANYDGKNDINENDAMKALTALKVDSIGLDDVDIKYLTTIIERFNGGPVGLETLAVAIGEEVTNLEDVYEPYLIQIGMIDRTPRGRRVTEKAYKHIGKYFSQSLFDL